jgi:DNA repair protein RecN (Recombination protein N)
VLRELRLRNFAVVESATVELAPGLNVLTGETGAGKSILVDAILLVRGSRAQADVIRSDADTATVEAVFLDVDGNRHLAVTLDEDPAADLQRWHGRFLYFSPDEVEPQ